MKPLGSEFTRSSQYPSGYHLKAVYGPSRLSYDYLLSTGLYGNNFVHRKRRLLLLLRMKKKLTFFGDDVSTKSALFDKLLRRFSKSLLLASKMKWRLTFVVKTVHVSSLYTRIVKRPSDARNNNRPARFQATARTWVQCTNCAKPHYDCILRHPIMLLHASQPFLTPQLSNFGTERLRTKTVSHQ